MRSKLKTSILSILVCLLSSTASAQFRDAAGNIDYGLLRPVIVNGDVVGEDQPQVLALTAMINQYRISKADYKALGPTADEKLARIGFGRCTGTVIAPDVILTAAHCVDADQWEEGVFVYVKGQEYRVKSVVQYPLYNKNVIFHDVALLFLKKEITNVQTALLPAPLSLIADDSELTLVGFGLTGKKSSDDIMRFVKVTGKENGDMGIFVAGDRTICSGDSGGPAYLQKDLRLVVVGITSTGNCSSIAYFMRVSDYVPWIEQAIAKFRSQLDI